MKNHENNQHDVTRIVHETGTQSQTGGNERQRFIVTKENYWPEESGTIKQRRKYLPVDEDFYFQWYRPIWAARKKAQEHGQCTCPNKYLWKCDGACEDCEYRAAGDTLSLDYTVSDSEGNEKSWLEDVADETTDMQSVLEDRELLAALTEKLDELDPEGRRICELIMQGFSERASAAELGLPRNTYTYRRDKVLAALAQALHNYK